MADVVIEYTIIEAPIFEFEFIEDPVLEFEIGPYVPGPQGPIGPAGGSVVSYIAGENLSSGRVVIIDGGQAFYFQPSNVAHSGRAYGITNASATTGNSVDIQVIGDVTDASYSIFSDQEVYVGADGELQTTKPVSGLLQKAGIAIGSNQVRIDFSTQIIL